MAQLSLFATKIPKSYLESFKLILYSMSTIILLFFFTSFITRAGRNAELNLNEINIRLSYQREMTLQFLLRAQNRREELLFESDNYCTESQLDIFSDSDQSDLSKYKLKDSKRS